MKKTKKLLSEHDLDTVNNCCSFSYNKKLKILNTIESESYPYDDSFSILSQLAQDKNAEIRNRVAQILANFHSLQSENILIKFLSDSDELIRANACDSLLFSSNYSIMERLKKVIKSDVTLVRGYAILTMSDIAINTHKVDEAIAFFQQILQKEKSPWIQLCCYEGLYKLGIHSYYNKILEQINNRYYRNRCATLNSLKRLVTNRTKEKTRIVLENRLEVEKIRSVKINIKSFLSEMSSSEST